MKRIPMADDLTFSQVIQGFWRLAAWDMTEQELLAFVERCMEIGITTFDHADIYGGYTCESLFGRVLQRKPHLRPSMQLVTKCGIKPKSARYPERYVGHYDTSKAHILKSVEASLRNLCTDYVDVLLIHRPDPFMDPQEVAEAFTQLKAEGKVRHFGVSNFLPSQFRMLSSYLSFPLITNQIEVSVTHLEHFEKGTIDLCLEKRIAPMVWSPLAGGKLFSDLSERAFRVRTTLQQVAVELGASSLDEVMYAWLLSHPAHLLPIVGSGKLERVEAAVRATTLAMDRQQWFYILESSHGHPVP